MFAILHALGVFVADYSVKVAGYEARIKAQQTVAVDRLTKKLGKVRIARH
jgi:hypothetical protein